MSVTNEFEKTHRRCELRYIVGDCQGELNLLLELLLLLILVSDLELLLGGRLQLLAIKLLQLLNGVLTDWINHVGHLIASLAQRSTQWDRWGCRA
eukprot:824570-Amphidinium_carterae.1